MRIFLIGLSLLYVLGVSYARTIGFGAGVLLSDCAAVIDLAAFTRSDETPEIRYDSKRITNKKMTNSDLAPGERRYNARLEQDEVIPRKIGGC